VKIKKITDKNKRDFKAIFICEHCGNEEERFGHDDTFFHTKIIPNMQCEKCGQASPVKKKTIKRYV